MSKSQTAAAAQPRALCLSINYQPYKLRCVCGSLFVNGREVYYFIDEADKTLTFSAGITNTMFGEMMLKVIGARGVSGVREPKIKPFPTRAVPRAKNTKILFLGGHPVPTPVLAVERDGTRRYPDGKKWLDVEQAARRYSVPVDALLDQWVAVWTDALPDEPEGGAS